MSSPIFVASGCPVTIEAYCCLFDVTHILDIKKHKKIIDLQVHNQIYKCQLNDKKDILITNTKGQTFSSDLLKSSKNLNKKQLVFAKKILCFAEIALGKAA